MIHIYYGFGKGKTSSAIGAGMRAYGASLKVLLVQFFKDSKSSELKSIPFDVFPAPDELSFNPSDDYKGWVDSAISFVNSSDSDVIILDEFMDAIPRFASLDSICFDDSKEYIITGHKPNEELMKIADYVTHFEKIRHPFDAGTKARKGIEF